MNATTLQQRKALPGALPSAQPAAAKPDTQPAKTVDADGIASLLALLKIEADGRGCADRSELLFLLANEGRKIVRARQIFVLTLGDGGKARVLAGSSVAHVDPAAPLVEWIEGVAERIGTEKGFGESETFTIPAHCDPGHPQTASYPLRHLLFAPMKRRNGRVFAGLMLARETPWLETHVQVTERLAESFGHAWLAIEPNARFDGLVGMLKRRRLSIALASALLALFPVSMSTLAPAEITARDAFIVAAPIDGVVETVAVEPNSAVSEGQLLIEFADTVLRNRSEIAEQEYQVATAKLKKSAQLAFGDLRGRQEMGIARAELDLKAAERDYANDLLAKATVRAPRAGLVIFSDKKDLAGRPASVGERLMEIADSRLIEVTINVPVADAIVLKPGARAKLFLDSDPLSSLEARVVRTSYQAQPVANGTMAYTVVATLADGSQTLPRLGNRGTAQIYSDPVPFAFYILRRPISALRQWIGL